MIIQIGEVYMNEATNCAIIFPNKTRKYLLPCLKEYGQEFMHRLNNVFKIAVGIGDMVVINNGLTKYEKHLFVLLDTEIAKSYFVSFIEWIREQGMYQDDYVYGNIQKSTYHIVVLKFPEKYYDSFTIFKKGKYSEMFKSIEDFNMFENYPEAKKVFIKDHNYNLVFTQELNVVFNMKPPYDLKPGEYEGELDLPPTDETEIFNHHLKKK